MPDERLKRTLDALHEQLDADDRLGEDDRAALVQTMREIRTALERHSEAPEVATPDESLRERIAHSIERFEANHPAFAELLQRVAESLSNSGI